MAADIKSNLYEWSATAGSNQPDGTDSLTNLDDNLRELQAVIYGYLYSKGADIASAATPDPKITGLLHAVTGTTTLTGLATAAPGAWKMLKFAANPTLKHSATFNLPGNADIQCATGDYMLAISTTSTGSWDVPFFGKDSGMPVAGGFGFLNKIIGGDFTTNPWQRGTTFTAPVSSVGTADCWTINYVTSAVVDVLKTADAPTPVETGGHYTAHCLHVDVTTADAAIAAGDHLQITTRLEGLNVASFGFGQAGTRYVTLSFWVKAAKTGIHCAALRNSAGDRSYVKEYTVSAANTWEYKTLTFPVDTSGTWLYDTGIGLRVNFTLAAGSTYQTTADTWAAGNFIATINQVNELDNVANNFKVALVDLRAGQIAPATYEVRSVQEELALSQRYLPVIAQPSSYIGVGQCSTATAALASVNFQVPTRVAVTGVTVSAASDFQVLVAAGVGEYCTSITFGTGNQLGCTLIVGVASGLVAGDATLLYAANANSKLTFTGAEL